MSSTFFMARFKCLIIFLLYGMPYFFLGCGDTSFPSKITSSHASLWQSIDPHKPASPPLQRPFRPLDGEKLPFRQYRNQKIEPKRIYLSSSKSIQAGKTSVRMDEPSWTPTDQDFAETVDVQFTMDIISLAEQLDFDPKKIYEHVLNHYEYEPYYFGSLKGTQETFYQKAGNEYDLSSLLIALLRVSGVPARYVKGRVRMPIDKVMSWLGVEDALTAASILSISEHHVSLLILNGQIVGLELDHLWVEAKVEATDSLTEDHKKFHKDFIQKHREFMAEFQRSHKNFQHLHRKDRDDPSQHKAFMKDFIKRHKALMKDYIERHKAFHKEGGTQTVVLDPSFKLHQFTVGRNIAKEAGLSGEELLTTLLDSSEALPEIPVLGQVPMDLVDDLQASRLKQILDYLETYEPDLTMNQIIGGKEIIPTTVTQLPWEQPFSFSGTKPIRFSQIPHTERQYIRFQTAGLDSLLPLPEIASKRVTLSYQAASALDQSRIDAFGGILQTPPASVNLRAQLKIDGEVRATGDPAPIGYFYPFAIDFMRGDFRLGPALYLGRALHYVTLSS